MSYGRVVGQCGTCLFAKEFGFANTISGPEDGVHCISLEHAKFNDGIEGGNGDHRNMAELTEFGFMDLWRLEALAEKSFRCPHWISKEAKVICNHCGVTYEDNESIEMVRKWSAEGYAPCPNLSCPGELEIKEE